LVSTKLTLRDLQNSLDPIQLASLFHEKASFLFVLMMSFSALPNRWDNCKAKTVSVEQEEEDTDKILEDVV